MSQFARGISPTAMRRLMSWQKQKQCWTKGLWQKPRAETVHRKERRCMQHCSMRPASTAWYNNGRTVRAQANAERKVDFLWIKKREETKHRTEWCAEADRYRCMRCGRGSKYMKMPGKCTGPNCCEKCLENVEDDIWEVMTW